jgi:SAM-dependent methyltransferase
MRQPDDKPPRTSPDREVCGVRFPSWADRSDQEWYRRSFGRDYLLIYQARSAQQARREVAWLREVLPLRLDHLILDMCCGGGRHALALAAEGFNVVGMDLSPELLREAHRDSQEQGLRLPLVRADMRALPFRAHFDVVLNLFTSFGYFPTDQQHEEVVRGVAASLVPGGRFLLDLPNRRHVIEHLVPCTEERRGGLSILSRRRISRDGTRVKKDIVLDDGRHRRSYHESVRLFTLEELSSLARPSGLVLQERWGNLDGSSYDEAASPRLITLWRLSAP